jgi:hypothetical protein
MPSETDIQVSRPPSLKSCNKAADEQALTGKDRAAFVKNCLAGNTSVPEDE